MELGEEIEYFKEFNICDLYTRKIMCIKWLNWMESIEIFTKNKI